MLPSSCGSCGRAGVLTAERGACGGYRLARPATEIRLSEVMHVLDKPLFGEGFCESHTGLNGACVHKGGCTLRVLWNAIDAALSSVLDDLALADLLDVSVVQARFAKEGV